MYQNYKPAIFMPLRAIKMEHKIIALRLKIALFGIDWNRGMWSIISINI